MEEHYRIMEGNGMCVQHFIFWLVTPVRRNNLNDTDIDKPVMLQRIFKHMV
jgi:hypothetical protein